jgi:3-polyprenyl-4-hydroxybenzoate decarboxylase
LSPYYSAGDDAVYNEIARDRTQSEIEQKKAQLKQSVNRERDRRWPGTVNCDLAGDGSLVIPADARNDTDLRNIQAVTTTAQVVAGTPDAVLKFRDANDITHNLSPEEVITLGLIVQAHVQSFYEKAWTLKDSIDSMTSVELDQLDVTSNTHWG